MKELILYIVQNLVDNPDQVTVTEIDKSNYTLYEIRAEKSDMGRVIGRQGRIIREIRSLCHSVAKRQEKQISVEVVD